MAEQVLIMFSSLVGVHEDTFESISLPPQNRLQHDQCGERLGDERLLESEALSLQKPITVEWTVN